MTVGSSISYTTLIGAKTVAGSIAGWLNHDSVVAQAPTILMNAEAAIYRRLRHWRMLKKATASMTANNPGGASPTDYIAIPSDYLEDKVIYLAGTNACKLTRKTMEEVISSYDYDGSGFRIPSRPVIYFNDATNILFDSPPDSAYPYLMYYYAQPAALDGSNLTNFITIFYPRLLQCTCCLMAAEFMKDVGVGNYDRTYWAQQAQAELDIANVESDRSTRSQELGMIIL